MMITGSELPLAFFPDLIISTWYSKTPVTLATVFGGESLLLLTISRIGAPKAVVSSRLRRDPHSSG